jgi:hypothetical protein
MTHTTSKRYKTVRTVTHRHTKKSIAYRRAEPVSPKVYSNVHTMLAQDTGEPGAVARNTFNIRIFYKF